MFTGRQIKALSMHRYVSEGVSMCEPVMQVLWNFLFKFVPRTCAPNALTLAGLLHNLTTTSVMIFYNPDGTKEVPCWVYLSCAYSVFVYIAFDALDGKQARKTRDGPLEEFFDHGFDSLSTVCVVLSVCFSLKLGQNLSALLVLVCLSQISCYVSIWQKYVTGVMKFDRIDVIEGNIAVVFIHELCALRPAVFDTIVPMINVTVRCLCVASSVVMSIQFVVKQLVVILKIQTKTKRRGTISPVVPIGLAVGLQIATVAMTHLYSDHPCLFLVTCGVVVSKITLKLIVADMIKDEMAKFDTVLLGPALLLVNHILWSIIPEYVLLWIVCIYSVQNWLVYFCTVSRDICHHLNIYCFSITSRPNLKSRMSLG